MSSPQQGYQAQTTGVSSGDQVTDLAFLLSTWGPLWTEYQTAYQIYQDKLKEHQKHFFFIKLVAGSFSAIVGGIAGGLAIKWLASLIPHTSDAGNILTLLLAVLLIIALYLVLITVVLGVVASWADIVKPNEPLKPELPNLPHGTHLGQIELLVKVEGVPGQYQANAYIPGKHD